MNGNLFPPIVYSGSIERIDFGERKEEKGFCYVTIHEKEMTTFEFIKTPTRPFIQIEARLYDPEHQTELLIEEIEKHALEGAIVKILYHLPPHAKDQVDLSKIQKACAQAWCLIGIFPVRAQETRERRAVLKVDMDLQQLLTVYFDTKPEYHAQKKELIKKALELSSNVTLDPSQANI